MENSSTVSDQRLSRIFWRGTNAFGVTQRHHNGEKTLNTVPLFSFQNTINKILHKQMTSLHQTEQHWQ